MTQGVRILIIVMFKTHFLSHAESIQSLLLLLDGYNLHCKWNHDGMRQGFHH